jgi:low temperature requirement protein LtrA
MVPAPLRFWLWGVALVVDVGTPLASAHLSVQAPPHPAHLPERYGLFTIILLGESLVAVMKGMESQEGWSVSAALSAFLGMAIAFLVWWWYFDGAQGAAERTVRSRRDARAFVVWSYAHLPLYLGIAVAGVGIEHIVTIAPDGHLHGAESWILGGAVTLLMLALTTIGLTSDRALHDGAPAGGAMPQFFVACLPVLLAPVADTAPLVAIVGMIASLCLCQAVLAQARHAALPAGAKPEFADLSL